MPAIPILQLILAVVVIALGLASRGTGRRTLLLGGAFNGAFALFLMVPENATVLRALSLGAFVVFLIVIATSVERATWKLAAPELVLVALTIVAIGAFVISSQFATQLSSTFAALASVLSASAIATMLIRFGKAFRSAQSLRPSPER
jgi:hypothetical protein